MPTAPTLAFAALGQNLPVNPDALPAGFAEVERQIQGMGAVVQTSTPHEFPRVDEYETPGDYAFARLQHVETHPEDYERQAGASPAFAAPYGAAPTPTVPAPAVPMEQVTTALSHHLNFLERLSSDVTELQRSFEARFDALAARLDTGTPVGAPKAEESTPVEAPTAEDTEELTPAGWAAQLMWQHADLMQEFAQFVDTHGVRPADFLAAVGPSTSEAVNIPVTASVLAERVSVVAEVTPPEEENLKEEGVSVQTSTEENPQEELPWDPTDSSTPETPGEVEEEVPDVPDERLLELHQVTPNSPVDELKAALRKVERAYKTLQERQALQAKSVADTKAAWDKQAENATPDSPAREMPARLYQDALEQFNRVEAQIREHAGLVAKLEAWSGIVRRKPRK